MFFKNILLYKLIDSFMYSSEDFHEELQKNLYYPCPKSERSSYGWVSPFGSDHELLVLSSQGNHLFAFCKEEKILPSTVIRDELNKKIALIETNEDRKVYKKEKQNLKEQIILNLTQQAFSRKKLTYAYLDTQSNYLLIDTSSKNKAEELCGFLRKTLGSLKLALPTTHSKPGTVMSKWLLENLNPPKFNIENNCNMLDPKQKNASIKFQQQDLSAKEIVNHLHSGKQIVKLTMNWQEKISFEFNDDLSIKKIRFLDIVEEQRMEKKERSRQEQLDADFVLMSGEFSQFLQDLWVLFDGLTIN